MTEWQTSLYANLYKSKPGLFNVSITDILNWKILLWLAIYALYIKGDQKPVLLYSLYVPRLYSFDNKKIVQGMFNIMRYNTVIYKIHV